MLADTDDGSETMTFLVAVVGMALFATVLMGMVYWLLGPFLEWLRKQTFDDNRR